METNRIEKKQLTIKLDNKKLVRVPVVQ